MLNSVLGSFSSGVAASTTSYESIATVTVGSGGSASVTFSSIPSTYKHLQIRGIARANGTGTHQVTNFRFNSDTGSNYSFHGLLGDGATASSEGYANQSAARFWMITSGSSNASTFGGFVLDILEYANTNIYKTQRTLAGDDVNGSGYIVLTSSNWRNTSAITSINLYPDSGSFVQYSEFALYGIKGA